jgi:DNA polymerase
MLIGEAPGASEDFFGRPFVGLAGGYLSQLLDRVGLSRGNIYITNVVLCRPHTATANRPPTPAEKLACRNRLIAEIRLVQPKVVALLGDVALHALFPDRNSISRERGAYLYHEDFPGVTFIATFHPSMLMRIQQGMVTNQGLQGAHPDIHRALFDWHMIRDKVVEG